MKKIFIVLSVIAFLIYLISLKIESPHVAYAEDNEKKDEVNETVNEAFTSVLDDMDLSVFEEFLRETEIFNAETSVQDLIKKIINNDSTYSFDFFLKYIIRYFLGDIKSIVAEVILILLICILLSIMQNASSGFSKASTKKIVYLACYGIVITSITVLIGTAIADANTLIQKVERFSTTFFPIMLALMNMIGASASIAVYQPLFLVFTNILIKVITYFVMPLFYCCFVFYIVGNLSEDIKLEKAAKFLQSLANWTMGILFGSFVTFTTAQGITGASVDSLAAKGLKYVLSGYVPVIGNYLKDGFDVIIAGCLIVKNSLGMVSVILLFALLLPVCLKLVLSSLSLQLTASLCEPFSDKKISSMLSGVSKALYIPIIAVISLIFTLLIIVMLIILTCNRGII